MRLMSEMVTSSYLMQGHHPGYKAFLKGSSMSEISYPVFFDYTLHVCEAFRFRVSWKETNNTLVSENVLMHIIDLLRKIDQSDDPYIVIPIRDKIRAGCMVFQEFCEMMGEYLYV